MNQLGKWRSSSRKVWNFMWNDDSLWSWLANIIVAFLVIRFILYPLLGLGLGTPFPIVAVVSESMEHRVYNQQICGKTIAEFQESLSNYWQSCGEWYEKKGISERDFRSFPFHQGFDKGDVIILWRARNIQLGDILVFEGNRPQPIIHRVVDIFEENGELLYQTKGDHNSDTLSQGLSEDKIKPERIYGKGIIRIPYLGWIKILFVDAVRPLGINIER